MESISLTYNKGIVLADCDTAWSESSGSGVTESADTTNKQTGRAAAKFVTVGVGANVLLGTNRVRNLDISDGVKIKGWIRCSIALAAGDLRLLLAPDASCATPYENTTAWDMPAAPTPNTWVAFEITPATPSAMTAVLSIGLKQIVNLADCSIWIDDVYATLPTTSFDVLSVKGMDDPGEGVQGTGMFEKLTDAGYFSTKKTFQRSIEVNFGVIETKANRLAFFRWWFRADIQQVTYGSETLDVVCTDDPLDATWEHGFKYTRSFTVHLVEKNARRGIPTSWTS